MVMSGEEISNSTEIIISKANNDSLICEHKQINIIPSEGGITPPPLEKKVQIVILQFTLTLIT